MECTEDYISPDYLPTDMKLREPSKLSKAAAHRLLKFWYDRQEDSKCRVPFAFHAVKSNSGGLEAVDIKKRPISSSSLTVLPADAPSVTGGQGGTGSPGQVTARRRPTARSKRSKTVRPLPYSSKPHDPMTGKVDSNQHSRKRQAEDPSPSSRPDKKKKEDIHDVNSGIRRSGRQQTLRPNSKRLNIFDVGGDDGDGKDGKLPVQQGALTERREGNISSGNVVRRSSRNKK